MSFWHPALGQILAAGSTGDPLGFGPNFWLSFWTAVTFLTVFLVLKKKAWGPILKVLEDRTAKIRGDIEAAEKGKADVEGLKIEYQGKLDAARDEVREIVEEGKRDASKIRSDAAEAATQEAAEIKARASRQTQLEEAKALEEVWDIAADLATDLAGRMIGKSLSPDDHTALVSQVIDEYKATMSGGGDA